MKFLRHWPVAVGALLPLVAIAELIGNAWTADLVPPYEAFLAPRKIVAEQHQEGDLVLVYPDWMGDGRVALGAWMPLPDQARPDIFEYPRIWELTLTGRQAPDVAGLPVERRWDFDGLTLTLYRNTRHAPATWRAFNDVAAARVVLATGEGDKPCRWDEHQQQHLCGEPFGEAWVYVGPFVLTDFDQQPHDCLWAHPTERGPIVATWDDVPSGTQLTVHTGLTYIAARDMDKKPVRVDVKVDGQLVGTAWQADGQPWRSWSFAVPPGPERRSVQLSISTEFQGMRHFCFDAAMRGAP